MLKITKMEDKGATVVLKLEGKVTDEWAALLDEECRSVLGTGRRLLLNCTDVQFLDDSGVDVLRNLPSPQVTLMGAPGFVTELLETGGQS
jgi:anti-anti-sigma regulatory factor